MKQPNTIYLLLVSIAIITLIIGCEDSSSSNSDSSTGNDNSTTEDIRNSELTYDTTTILDYKETTIEPSKNTITDSARIIYSIFLKEDGKVPTKLVKGIKIENNSKIIVATSAAKGTHTLTVTAKVDPNQDFYIGEITTDITIIINATDLSTFDLTYDTTAKQTFGTANRFPTIRNTLPTAGINYTLTATQNTNTANVPSGITLDNTTLIFNMYTKPGIHYITVIATPDSTITRLTKTAKADVVITVEGKALPPIAAVITNLDAGSTSEKTDITYKAITVKWNAPSDFGYKVDGEKATFKEYKVYYKAGLTVNEDNGTLVSTVTKDDASSREATITGLEDNTEYSMIVSTINTAEESTASEILTRLTDTNYSNPPTIDIIDAHTTINSDSISIRWQTPKKGNMPDGKAATTINWYKVYHKVGTTITQADRNEANADAKNGTSLSSTIVKELANDIVGHTLENLSSNTQFAFQVEVNTDAGESGLSGYSAVKTATTTQ